MRRRDTPFDELLTFGGRVPSVVGGLIAILVIASLAGALVPGLRSAAVLFPGAVWAGQLWRVVTYPFFESDPLSLVFGAMMLYWFGRDLSYAWGPRRFLITFVSFGAAAGVVTCLVARLWPAVWAHPYLGIWPVADAMVVAWAMIFPERQILLYFALPVSGQALLYLTVGGTLLYSVFGGLAAFVPHLAAEAMMLVLARGYSLRGLWQTMRIRSQERRARRRARHLKVVGKESEPPRWMN
ncbi:rhomboid family intramembrane serine protease [Anaeromyxobacter paludicola]|uniref:Peptidase S54 rhomboid domain-containing protein n=1 Tax=Anaeromyxobacter paludicola TaxID=2918171 RepID=A0ABN6N935_9BACT|nr:rhomboid family intramembrane serine protease [Anaeromyxobacter paludicola]BDG09759.1 hypothetical protein AMPC_28720 [Anaeromyxobacter paludicola]